MVISSIALAVAPKCPFCLMSFLGAFGVTFVAAPFYRAWLPPLTAVWLVLTVGVLAVPSGGQRHYGPVLLGLLASLAVFGGKFVLNHPALVYAGMAALLGAAVWRAWRRNRVEPEQCVPCERPSLGHTGGPAMKKLIQLPTREGR
jgi:hypothetical protein